MTYIPVNDPFTDPVSKALNEVWRRYLVSLGPWILSAPILATIATPVVNNTATLAATGLSAVLTPLTKNSRVLVFIAQAGIRKDMGDTGVQVKLQRDGANIYTLSENAGKTDSNATNDIGSVSGIYIDSPMTRAEVTYRTVFASKAGIAAARVQAGSETSAILLVEVAG